MEFLVKQSPDRNENLYNCDNGISGEAKSRQTRKFKTTVTMEYSKLSNVANKFDKTVFDHENLTKTTWQVKLTIQIWLVKLTLQNIEINSPPPSRQ